MSKTSIFFASLFFASMIFLFFSKSAFLDFEHPRVVKLNSPAFAVQDASNMHIVDSSRKRLLRRDASGRVDLILKAGRGRFSEIYDLAAADGGIFILDTVRDLQTRRIKSEILQQYSPDGRFVREVFREDHKKPTFNRTIPGLARNGKGQCSFITLEENRFILHSVNPDKPETLDETVYSFPMASELINHFDVGEPDAVFFTTKRGGIYKVDALEARCIFSSQAKVEGGTGAVPWDVSLGADGRLYFTDLSQRGLYSIEPSSGKSPESVYHDPDTIYYRVFAQNGLVAVSESKIMTLRDGKETFFDEIGVSDAMLALRLASWFSAIILLVGCVWGAIRLLRFLLGQDSFVIKFSAAVIAGTLFITVVFCLIVTKDITNRMTRDMLNRLTNVADLLAMQLPKEPLSRLDSVDDYMNEDYTAVKSLIEKFMLSRDEYSDMYCVLYKVLDGAIAEVFESDNNHGIVNYPYNWFSEDSDEMEILKTGGYKTYLDPSWVDGGVIFSLCPMYGQTGASIGLIEIGMDLKAFQEENKNLILNLFVNVISMSVAMIIIVIEFLVFIDGRRKMRTLADRGVIRVPVEITRGAVFLVYFITNVSTSFLPIYARDLLAAEGTPPSFPVEFLIAAPISADVAMGAFASLFGTRIVKELGPRRTAAWGGLMAVAGIALECAFMDIFMLTAGFALCGFGCGLTLFLANLTIAGEEDGVEKEKGFAGVTAAVTSGVNGGVIFGAFLTNWLSHRAVLAASGLVSVVFLVFSLQYMTKVKLPSFKNDSASGEMNTAQFLFSPRVSLYMLALLAPAIASGYFLIYLFPILGFDFGISESNIGYSFLLNSLVVIFLSSSLTRFFSKSLGKPISLTLWTLLYAGAFATFAVFQNVETLLLVLVLMGFADSFGQSLSTSYYTELPDVKSYGYGRAIGISSVVENGAQAVGPFVFSYALHVGVSKGLLQIAGGLAALSLVFLLSSIKSKGNEVGKEA
jgi:predicted MFS family arabinose efflux permease